jgi:hypothetical protein
LRLSNTGPRPERQRPRIISIEFAMGVS